MQLQPLTRHLLGGLALMITTAFPCKNEEMNKKTAEQASPSKPLPEQVLSAEPLPDITKAQKNITQIKADVTAHKSYASASDFVTIIGALKNDFSGDTRMLKSLAEEAEALPKKCTAKEEELKHLDEEIGKKFEDLMKDKAARKSSLACKQEKVTQLLTTITDLTTEIADTDEKILLQTTNTKDLNALDEETVETLIHDIDHLIETHQSLKEEHDQAVATVNDIIQQFPHNNENIKALVEAIREQVCVCKEDRF